MFHKFFDEKEKPESPKLQAESVAFNIAEDGVLDVQALKEAIDRIAASFAFNNIPPAQQAENEEFVVGLMTGVSLMLRVHRMPAFTDTPELSAGLIYIIKTVTAAHPDKFKLVRKKK